MVVHRGTGEWGWCNGVENLCVCCPSVELVRPIALLLFSTTWFLLLYNTRQLYTAVGELYCGLGNYIPFLIYILTYFFCMELNQNHVLTKTIQKMLLREKAFVCECVRSNINFCPRNQDVDFDMLKMFFSFPWAKYDEKRWLNIKLFFRKKRDIIVVNRQCIYFALLWHTVYCCVIQWLVTSDGSDGTRNDPGRPENEWEWLSRCLGGPQGLK